MLEGRRKEKLYYEESNGKKLKDKDKYDGEVWASNFEKKTKNKSEI